jgi:spore maturation protein CgeB
MKILFVAVFTPNSTNVSQSRGFKDNGCEVYEYDYRNRLNVLRSVEKRDNELINLIHSYKPNITVFSKCNNMGGRVVDEANKVGKTVLWYMDATGNFDNELKYKIKKSTVAVHGIPGMVKYSKEYNYNSFFIDQCPDEKMNFMLDDFEYKYDVTFIGQISNVVTHTDRKKYLNSVGFKHFNNVYGLEHNKIVNESKINLNFSHTDGTGASVRIYKILASGGFLMTTPWVKKYMEKSFTINKDFVIFTNEKDLKEKINYYLNNENERNEIRLCGYNTVQKYLPNSWASRIIKKINNIS